MTHHPQPLILGIETSCDESSVALLDGDGRVRANLIASQIERHRPFGGVVPEIASREHLDHLMPLLRDALTSSGCDLEDLTAIAVTSGPGLIGSLLVGVATAQGLAYGLGIPLIGVNHLEGHVFSPYLGSGDRAVERPDRFLGLVVSGGHSSIYDVRRGGDISIRMLNRTRDDAAGEVLDKVAKFVGLPYPGGPFVEATGRDGDPDAFPMPAVQCKEGELDYSFSGLKSSAIRSARKAGLEGTATGGERTRALADFCASLQKAVIDQILDRLDRIWSLVSAQSDPPTEIALAGGVAANGPLRERLRAYGEKRQIQIRIAEKKFCTDNAAMIGFAGLLRGESAFRDPKRIEVRSRVQIGTA